MASGHSPGIEIFSKSLINRLKLQLETIIHNAQAYCVPGWSIHDDLHRFHDIMDLEKLSNMNFGLLSLKQEKAFDRMGHDYLFKALRAFGGGRAFYCWGEIALCRGLTFSEGSWGAV